MKTFAVVNGGGLIAVPTSNPDWGLAHKLMMPSFSTIVVKVYHYQVG
jgi:hypothetical protein